MGIIINFVHQLVGTSDHLVIVVISDSFIVWIVGGLTTKDILATQGLSAE
jgi:hypothetical protein